MIRFRSLIVAAGVSLSSCFTVASSAEAQISSGVVTHVLLGDLEKKADGVISRARNAGDALLWNAARQAKDVIEAWRNSNAQLLDKAFEGLDKISRELFQNIDSTLDQLSKERELAVGDVQRISVELAQLVKSIPGTNKDAELWYYTPRVIVPVGKDDVILRLIGPKLSQSKLEIKSPKNEPIAANVATEGEINARLNRQNLQFDQSTSRFVTYTLNFIQSEGTFKDKSVSRELTMWLPPTIMARYKITPKVRQITYEHQEYPTDVGGKGKDSPYPVTIAVRPDLANAGWEIDVDRVINPRPGWYSDLGGDKADCAGLYNNQVSKESFVFNIQLGHKTKFGGKSDAWKNCRVFVPVRRAVTKIIDAEPLEGELNWSDDKRREIPSEIVEVMIGKVIEVKLFNGRTHIIDTQNRSPLGLLTVDDNGSSVLFKPRPPSQF